VIGQRKAIDGLARTECARGVLQEELRWKTWHRCIYAVAFVRLDPECADIIERLSDRQSNG